MTDRTTQARDEGMLCTTLAVQFPDGFSRAYVCEPADETGEFFLEPLEFAGDLIDHARMALLACDCECCPDVASEAIFNQANAQHSQRGEWRGVRWVRIQVQR